LVDVSTWRAALVKTMMVSGDAVKRGERKG